MTTHKFEATGAEAPTILQHPAVKVQRVYGCLPEDDRDVLTIMEPLAYRRFRKRIVPFQIDRSVSCTIGARPVRHFLDSNVDGLKQFRMQRL